ncbi:hypothetical protein LNP05_29300 [Klebsiella pneumoniae subsp. pneumoniae]|nr:hypothetical protein [Klebsiella pneumoniae subsp. pneumoniae]
MGRFLYLGFVAGQGRKLLCLGLAGYTALIIIITIHTNPMLAPQFTLSNAAAKLSSVLSAPSSPISCFRRVRLKKRSTSELDNLLIAQYKLMQLCVAHGEKRGSGSSLGALVRRTTALEGMRSNLIMWNPSRWAKANQRLKAINTFR